VLLEVSRRVAGCDSRVAVAEREERGGPGCRSIAPVDSWTIRLRSVYDIHCTDLTSGIACYTYDTPVRLRYLRYFVYREPDLPKKLFVLRSD
jgi:hypothetical protein